MGSSRHLNDKLTSASSGPRQDRKLSGVWCSAGLFTIIVFLPKSCYSFMNFNILKLQIDYRNQNCRFVKFIIKRTKDFTFFWNKHYSVKVSPIIIREIFSQFLDSIIFQFTLLSPCISFPSIKLPPETRHALSLQQPRAVVQPAFVFDENVPAKISVQTPRRQAKTLPMYGFSSEFYVESVAGPLPG